MSKIELLKDGVVYNTILASAEFADMYFSGSWRYALGSGPAPTVVPLLKRQEQKWEQIKQERDRRKYLGIKVDNHWFHSDDPSRIQQIALRMLGESIPVGLQWKTLTLQVPPAFVEMTPALASGIFIGTILSDAAVFAAAELHKVTMEALTNPEDYDYSNNWPLSIEDELLY